MTFFELCVLLGHVQDLLSYYNQKRSPLADLTSQLEAFKRKHLHSIVQRVTQDQKGNVFAKIVLNGQIEGDFNEILMQANHFKESLQGADRQHIERLSNLRKAVAEYYTKESEFIARMQSLDVQFYTSKFQQLNGKVLAATLAEVTITLQEFSRLQNFLQLNVQECASLIDNPGMGIILLEVKFFRPDGYVLEHVERIRKLASQYLKIVELINACAKAKIYEFSLAQQSLLAEPFQRLARYVFVAQLGSMLADLEPCKNLFDADYYDQYQSKVITYGHARLCSVVQGLAEVATTQLKVFNQAEKIREFLEKRVNPALYDPTAPVNRIAHLLEFQKEILSVITERKFSNWPDDAATINKMLIDIGLTKFNEVFAMGNREFCHDVLSDLAIPFIEFYNSHLRKYQISTPKRDDENDSDYKIRYIGFFLCARIEDAILQGEFLTKNLDQALFFICRELSATVSLPFDDIYFKDNRVRLARQITQELVAAERVYHDHITQEAQTASTMPSQSVEKLREYNQAEHELHATVIELIASGCYLHFPDGETFLRRVLDLTKLIRSNLGNTLVDVSELNRMTASCKAYTELLRCQTPAEVYTRIDHQSFECQHDLHEAFPSDQAYQDYQRKTAEFFTRLEAFKDQAQNVAGGFQALLHRSKACFQEALICSPSDEMHFRKPQAYEAAIHRAAAASCFPLQLYYLPDDPKVKCYQQVLQAVSSDKEDAVTPILNTMLAKGEFKFTAVFADVLSPNMEACLTLLAVVAKNPELVEIITLLQAAYAFATAAQRQILQEKIIPSILVEIDLAATMDVAVIKQPAIRLYDLLRDNFTTLGADASASYEVADLFGLTLATMISGLSTMIKPEKKVKIEIADAYYTQSKITSAQLFSALLVELQQLVEDEHYDQTQRKTFSDLLIARKTERALVSDAEFYAETQRLLTALGTTFSQAVTTAKAQNNLGLDKVKQHMQSVLKLLEPKTGSEEKPAPISTKIPKANLPTPLELTSPYRGRKMALGITMTLFGLMLIGFAALAFFNPVLLPVVGVFFASHMVITSVVTLLSASLGMIISLGGISVAVLASQAPKAAVSVSGNDANPISKLGSAIPPRKVSTDLREKTTSSAFFPATTATSTDGALAKSTTHSGLILTCNR